MIKNIRQAAVSGIALVGSIALLAGCSSAPGSTATTAMSTFKPCIVSDGGGFDDKSFNQLGLEGLNAAASELGATPIKVQSHTATDYAPNLQSLVDQGCEAIVSVGFALSKDTVASALKNPKINYVLIDDAGDNDFNGKTDAPNLKPLLFNTAEAAFLAGYASAAISKTGVIGTFGGMNFPTVSIFMDGFKQGAEYYNTKNSKSVKVLGWNGKDGSFTGGFQANDTARQVAQSLIDQNADVILPVGGPIYQSAAAAITSSGKDIALLGVDADVTKTDPSVAKLIFTSVEKKIDVATKSAVLDAGKGNFSVDAYIGTLKNGGVDIAPLTGFASRIPANLQSDLDGLKQDIISGKVKVTSYLVK